MAGYRALGEEFDGPVVCVATSSGFKDLGVGEERFPVRTGLTAADLTA